MALKCSIFGLQNLGWGGGSPWTRYCNDDNRITCQMKNMQFSDHSTNCQTENAIRVNCGVQNACICLFLTSSIDGCL